MHLQQKVTRVSGCLYPLLCVGWQLESTPLSHELYIYVEKNWFHSPDYADDEWLNPFWKLCIVVDGFNQLIQKQSCVRSSTLTSHSFCLFHSGTFIVAAGCANPSFPLKWALISMSPMLIGFGLRVKMDKGLGFPWANWQSRMILCSLNCTLMIFQYKIRWKLNRKLSLITYYS